MAVVRSSSGGVVIAYVVYFRFMDDVIDVIFAHGPGLVEACRLSTMLRSYLSLVNCRLHHAVTSDVSVRYTLIPLATKCAHFYQAYYLPTRRPTVRVRVLDDESYLRQPVKCTRPWPRSSDHDVSNSIGQQRRRIFHLYFPLQSDCNDSSLHSTLQSAGSRPNTEDRAPDARSTHCWSGFIRPRFRNGEIKIDALSGSYSRLLKSGPDMQCRSAVVRGWGGGYDFKRQKILFKISWQKKMVRPWPDRPTTALCSGQGNVEVRQNCANLFESFQQPTFRGQSDVAINPVIVSHPAGLRSTDADLGGAINSKSFATSCLSEQDGQNKWLSEDKQILASYKLFKK